MWSGAGDAVLKLAERVGALIATTLMAKNWLSDAEYHAGISGFYGTRTALELFQEADCVIGIGASLNRYTTEHGYLYPNARYVHVDVRPHILMDAGAPRTVTSRPTRNSASRRSTLRLRRVPSHPRVIEHPR